MRAEFIVASKEFRDYLTSKRFLVLFGLLALLTIIGAVTGVSTYNSDLSTYNSDLSRAAAAGASAAGLRNFVTMPSILEIFSSYGTYIASFGMLLAVSMGFDLISREKEEGTLKILLTHPVFRDQVINGKIIGALAMLTVVLLSTFLAIVAIMLFFGIVPAGDDVVRLAAFFVAIVIFMLAYLAIAIMASTLAKNSSMAIMIAITIVLIGMIIPNVSSSIAETIVGSAPQVNVPTAGGSTFSGTTAGGTTFAIGAGNRTGNETRMGTPMEINPAYETYINNRNNIEQILNVISPSQDFTTISRMITDRQASPNDVTSGGDGAGGAGGLFVRLSGQTVSVWQSVTGAWEQILALIVMIVIGFGISYMKFVRSDVR